VASKAEEYHAIPRPSDARSSEGVRSSEGFIEVRGRHCGTQARTCNSAFLPKDFGIRQPLTLVAAGRTLHAKTFCENVLAVIESLTVVANRYGKWSRSNDASHLAGEFPQTHDTSSRLTPLDRGNRGRVGRDKPHRVRRWLKHVIFTRQGEFTHSLG
jgi:hypothetical protein